MLVWINFVVTSPQKNSNTLVSLSIREDGEPMLLFFFFLISIPLSFLLQTIPTTNRVPCILFLLCICVCLNLGT